MAKKKKPAANPARGFATTSVASKPKAEKVPESVTGLPKKDEATVPSPVIPAAPKEEPPKHAPQTPEELEAQLERDELQLLVEKHALKVRRESRRHVNKFQTDRRTLRPQAQSMTVHDWLPEDILETIISLAQAESNDSNRRQGQQSLTKILPEEDAVSKLWTLDLTLRELGFSGEHILPVLKWLCANAAAVDATSSIWGFQEALEWLALDQCEGHSFSYGEQKSKALTDSPNTSRPGKIVLQQSATSHYFCSRIPCRISTFRLKNVPFLLTHSRHSSISSDRGSQAKPHFSRVKV
jgi:ATP-dependent RNA helicase DHX29